MILARTLILALAVLLPVTSAVAQQTPEPPLISINVDRQPLVQSEPFVLTVHIESSSKGDPEIKLPHFGGFRVLQRSESHPMSFSFSFGTGAGSSSQTKKESNYTFVLVADKAGKYKLNPVEVVLDGRRYKGDPYSIEILKSGGGGAPGPVDPSQPTPANPTGQAGTIGNDPGNGAEAISGDLDGAKIDKDFFVQTKLSKKQAVIGEPVVMTIYLYSSQNVSGLDVIREPGTEGFWVENLREGNRRFTTEPVSVAGRSYERGILRKVVLFPIKPGQLTIAPTIVKLQTRRGGFFSRPKTTKRASVPVHLDVSKLPEESQPGGFDPANVGNFTFKASLDNVAVKVGEPVTLKLSVAGQGNIRNLALPELTELDGFKVYAPEIDSDVRIRGEMVQGKKEARVLMIPTNSGEYTVSPIEWSFFYPKAGTYKLVKSHPLKISVGGTKSVAEESSIPSNTPITAVAGQDRLNRKLKSILSRANLGTNGDSHTLTKPWFLTLAILAPLFYVGVIMISRTRRKLQEGNARTRSKRAFATATRRLKELTKGAGSLSPEEFFAELARTLVGFLEDRLEVSVAGDTSMELKDRLIGRGFSKELAEKVVAEVEACDFARFAHGAGRAGQQRQALERMDSLIKELATIDVLPLEEERP